MTVQIVWFKRDLRVTDHAPLARAAAAGPVLPLYIVEPQWWAQPTMGARQWAFVAESLRSLGMALRQRGAALHIATGEALTVFEQLHERHPFVLWSHEETGDAWSFARDRRVGAWARKRGVVWHEHPHGGVVRRLRSRDGWSGRLERHLRAAVIEPPARIEGVPAAQAPVPDAASLGLAADPCPGRQKGGREAAESLLQSFLTERGRTYRAAMASPAEGAEACSRLSPHFAWGTMSTREAARAARQRLSDISGAEALAWRASIRSFLSRLAWRDHFMQKLEDEPAIEHQCMHRAYEGLREDDHDDALLIAWSEGRTGLPFVDACMIALRETGWLNFRGRAMVTAVAAYHLWLDWRRFGPVLARRFTDYEPGIHFSQLQMQSGVTGVNTLRVYNPVKQSLDQDPHGAFIRRWVAPLRDVPAGFIHEPWRMDAATQAATGCIIGQDYPAPVVDHVAAARRARDRVYALRKGAAFTREKDAVLRRHASRKPGRDDGPSRRKRPGAEQLSFDF